MASAPPAEWLVDRRVDGSWLLTRGEGLAREVHVAYAVTDAAGAVWVRIAGETLVIPAVVRTRRQVAAVGTLEAPMPALVTAVLVQAGDIVPRGAPLLLLDAMKMELPMEAPYAGTVIAVHCAAGDRVTPGRALVDLAPAEAPA